MFQCFRDRKLLSDFIETVKARLDELENMDFAHEDVDSFCEVIERETTGLKSIGFSAYTYHKDEISFLERHVSVDMKGPHGIWTKHFSARVKTIAIQSRQCSLLPWEELVLGPNGKFDGVRETIKLSEHILAPIRNVRDAALAMLGPGPLPVAEMRRIVLGNKIELLECDEHFDLEMSYLLNGLDTVLEQKLLDGCLDVLPTSTVRVSIDEAIEKVAAMEKSPLCLAVGVVARAQISAVLKMLRSYQDGDPPAEQLQSQASRFFK